MLPVDRSSGVVSGVLCYALLGWTARGEGEESRQDIKLTTESPGELFVLFRFDPAALGEQEQFEVVEALPREFLGLLVWCR